MNLIKTIRCWRHGSRGTRSVRGVAAVEFALMAPVWMAMMLGTTDAATCMIVNERVDRIASTVSNLVTTQQSMSITRLNDITLSAGQLMQPYEFGSKGIVIVTSIFKPAGAPPVINWQYAGGGSLARSSKIGKPGTTVSLPNGLTMNDNDNVITSEVYYVYTPMFVNAGPLKEGDVYRVSIYKPRLSQLTTPPT